MLIGIFIIIALGIGTYLFGKYCTKSPSSIGTIVEPNVKIPLEYKPDDKITITVTYLDGTTESFSADEEVSLQEDGSFTFRIGPRCVTISRSGYRKLEEVHSNKDFSIED